MPDQNGGNNKGVGPHNPFQPQGQQRQQGYGNDGANAGGGGAHAGVGGFGASGGGGAGVGKNGMHVHGSVPTGAHGNDERHGIQNGGGAGDIGANADVTPINPFDTSDSPKVQNPFVAFGGGVDGQEREAKVEQSGGGGTGNIVRENDKGVGEVWMGSTHKAENVVEAEVVEKKARTSSGAEVVGKKARDFSEAEVVGKKAGTSSEAEVVEKKAKTHPAVGISPVAEVKKNIPGDATVSQPKKDDNSVQDFGHQVMDILDQAGITKGALIKTVIVIVVGIILVMGYFYGWYGMITNIFSKIPDIVGQEQSADTRTDFAGEQDGSTDAGQKPPVKIPVAEGVYNADSPFGIVSAYIFGLEFNRPDAVIKALPMGTWGNDAGIRAAWVFGRIADEKQVKFVEYVALLRKLQNIYDTDIYALLDMSTDRRAALDRHMEDISSLIDQAMIAVETLDTDLQAFQQQYDPHIQAKNLHESDFFNALNAFYGEAAYVNLGMFVKASQDAIAVKAYYNAEKSLRELFVAYLDVLKPRYNDISMNTEALIKGVHVFYVPKSDIKTIIRLGE